uniref:Peptide transporter PTR2 n=1 Tax=Aegilops tauschii subsp. strangulata TaxID=200361 RepID=A0A453G1B9_AEGTS
MDSGVLLPPGEPSTTSKPGGWPAALFLIAVEFVERVGFYGVQGNLITYLTGPLGLSTAAAAAGVNAWAGTASMLPLLGALAADSWIGRYRAIVAAGVLYLVSFGMLTVSSMVPPRQPQPAASPPASPPRAAFFYATIYVVALAQGFHKPNAQALGADQFPRSSPDSIASRSSFFNWLHFSCSLLRPKEQEGKGVMVKLLPIWMTSVVYAMVIVQVSTLFTKQGSTMDRRIGATTGLVVPPAALQSFVGLAIIASVPIYDRVPDALRSVGLALCMSIMGVGNYASGVLVSAVDWATMRTGESWFSDNLNRAHLDYFYWALAGVAALEVLVFLYFSTRYVYT